MQGLINDDIASIANIIVYSWFWINMSKYDTNNMPYFVQVLTEIVDLLPSSTYVDFNNKYR